MLGEGKIDFKYNSRLDNVTSTSDLSVILMMSRLHVRRKQGRSSLCSLCSPVSEEKHFGPCAGWNPRCPGQVLGRDGEGSELQRMFQGADPVVLT